MGNSAAVSPSQVNYPATMTHHRCKASYLRGVLSLLRRKPIRIRKRLSRALAAEFDSDCPIGRLLSRINEADVRARSVHQGLIYRATVLLDLPFGVPLITVVRLYLTHGLARNLAKIQTNFATIR